MMIGEHIFRTQILLNLLKFILWPKIWSRLVNVPCALERNSYSTLVGCQLDKLADGDCSISNYIIFLIFCVLFQSTTKMQWMYRNCTVSCPSPQRMSKTWWVLQWDTWLHVRKNFLTEGQLNTEMALHGRLRTLAPMWSLGRGSSCCG